MEKEDRILEYTINKTDLDDLTKENKKAVQKIGRNIDHRQQSLLAEEWKESKLKVLQSQKDQ